MRLASKDHQHPKKKFFDLMYFPLFENKSTENYSQMSKMLFKQQRGLQK